MGKFEAVVKFIEFNVWYDRTKESTTKKIEKSIKNEKAVIDA